MTRSLKKVKLHTWKQRKQLTSCTLDRRTGSNTCRPCWQFHPAVGAEQTPEVLVCECRWNCNQLAASLDWLSKTNKYCMYRNKHSTNITCCFVFFLFLLLPPFSQQRMIVPPPWTVTVHASKGRALVIAPQVDTATTESLRYMAHTKQCHTYLP